MENFKFFAPTAVLANYKPQELPEFAGNPMIAALPLSRSNDDLFDDMMCLPTFASEQRSLSDAGRMQKVVGLGNLLIPNLRHVRMARALDSLLRTGYLKRVPRTVETAERLQRIYDSEKLPNSAPGIAKIDNELSDLLMGPPGMGKTSSVKQFFSNIPQVIYHPDYNVYQVTYLHLEMPSDGASLHALAYGILHQLDRLFPQSDYYTKYTKRAQTAPALMISITKLLQNHYVGFVIADEIQNLTNAHAGKNKQTIMTELVTLCNRLGSPILFIGTNKAAQLFSLDARSSRRGVGHIEQWTRLDEFAPGTTGTNLDGRASVSDWDEFLSILWDFQWVKHPVPLDAAFSATMYNLCQGILDIAVKVFAAAQVRAIFDKTEKLTTELLVEAYEQDLQLVHPMLAALRGGHSRDLAQYPDLAPAGIKEMLDTAARRVRQKTSEAYSVKPTDSDFEARIATALAAGGIDEDAAIEAAQFVAEEGKASNLDEGVDRARRYVKTAHTHTPTLSKRAKAKSAPIEEIVYKPDDYRYAIALASKEKTSIYEQLQKLGMARPLGELLCLD